jgi:hypothetical protein
MAMCWRTISKSAAGAMEGTVGDRIDNVVPEDSDQSDGQRDVSP